MSFSPLFEINGKIDSSVSLMDGRIYAVIVSDEDYISALAWGALIAAAENDRPAWLISDSDPQRFLSFSDALAKDAKEAVASSQVNILQLNTSALPLAEVPSQQLLDEFDYFKIPEHSLVVIDRAEVWFDESTFDDQLIRIRDWRDWAERNGTSLLLLFHSQPDSVKALASDLVKSAHLFSGISHMRQVNDGVRWEVMSWFGLNSISINKLLRMDIGVDGHLTGTYIAQADAIEEIAFDENTVFAMNAVCSESLATKYNWHSVEHIERLLASVAGAVAATIILGFDRSVSLEQLGRTIYALRQRHGSRIKIVVRELNARLRYSQESLIIKLGANLVVPAELSHSRFLSMVNMVQGQRFFRMLPVSYEDAVASAIQEQGRGYLPPPKFVAAVNHSLDLSRTLSIQNALITLPLATGLTPIDALRYCTLKRDGDFCTADENGVYVYLSACHEEDVDVVLQNIIQLPVADLFSSETRYFSALAIHSVIENFSARAEASVLPDYTTDLAAIAAQEDSNAGLRTNDRALAGSALTIRLHPPAAKRRPLSLRIPPPSLDILA